MSKYNTKLLEKFLKDKKLSKATFCRESGVCFETTNKFLAGEDTVSIFTIIKIAKYTNIPLSKWINTSNRQKQDKKKKQEKDIA